MRACEPDGDCWARNLRSRMPCAPRASVRCACLRTTDAVDKSFLFLPGANELIPACEFESDVDASSQLTCPILSVWAMRLAFMKARARISRLITMRLKAAWQNTITLTPMRRQRACLRGALLAKWELSARSRWLSAAIWPDDRYGALSVPEHHS